MGFQIAQVLDLLLKLMQLLPFVMQAVEVFAPPGTGPAKKAMVKGVVKQMVTDDPVYDKLVDVAIETVHKQAAADMDKHREYYQGEFSGVNIGSYTGADSQVGGPGGAGDGGDGGGDPGGPAR